METIKIIKKGSYEVKISKQLNEFTNKLEYFTMNLQNNWDTVSPVQNRKPFKTLNWAIKYAIRFLSDK